MADGEKTEAPTAKHLKEAVDKGDVLQSRDLGAALVILVGGAWLAMLGPSMMRALEAMLRRALTFDARDLDDFEPLAKIFETAGGVLVPLAILLGLAVAAAIATPAMLGSIGFRWSALGFRPNKLNPLEGAKRIFGTQGLVELGKSLLKVALMGAVGIWLLMSRMASVTALGRGDLVTALAALGHTFTFAVLVMGLALTLIAGVDVPVQWFRRSQRLKMTREEIKEEHKQSEGSPEAKRALRRRQVETAKNSARKAVTEANVVLTNPTHFAVALRYRAGLDPAPIVVARGRGATAEAIREIAKEAAVPMLSYPQLARAIYFTTRAGQLIREDLYMAVATVLAFVFNIDRALAEGRSQPEIVVPDGARFDEHGRPGV